MASGYLSDSRGYGKEGSARADTPVWCPELGGREPPEIPLSVALPDDCEALRHSAGAASRHALKTFGARNKTRHNRNNPRHESNRARQRCAKRKLSYPSELAATRSLHHPEPP